MEDRCLPAGLGVLVSPQPGEQVETAAHRSLSLQTRAEAASAPSGMITATTSLSALTLRSTPPPPLPPPPSASPPRRFWPDAWSRKAAIRGCRDEWGVETQPLHATVEWGGKRLAAASNIVFSNVRCWVCWGCRRARWSD